MKQITTKTVATIGLLTSLCVILGYVESLIPINLAIPGIKIGLTNIVVLFALYRLDIKSALLINIARILIVGFLFGTGTSIIYSLSGGLISFTVMLLAKKVFSLSLFSVSILGGIFHNVGQILACMLLLNTYSVLYYLVILYFTGIFSGATIGFIAYLILKKVAHYEI